MPSLGIGLGLHHHRLPLTDGGAPPPPVFVPSLDFSDARNSQYVPVVF